MFDQSARSGRRRQSWLGQVGGRLVPAEGQSSGSDASDRRLDVARCRQEVQPELVEGVLPARPGGRRRVIRRRSVRPPGRRARTRRRGCSAVGASPEFALDLSRHHRLRRAGRPDWSYATVARAYRSRRRRVVWVIVAVTASRRRCCVRAAVRMPLVMGCRAVGRPRAGSLRSRCCERVLTVGSSPSLAALTPCRCTVRSLVSVRRRERTGVRLARSSLSRVGAGRADAASVAGRRGGSPASRVLLRAMIGVAAVASTPCYFLPACDTSATADRGSPASALTCASSGLAPRPRWSGAPVRGIIAGVQAALGMRGEDEGHLVQRMSTVGMMIHLLRLVAGAIHEVHCGPKSVNSYVAVMAGSSRVRYGTSSAVSPVAGTPRDAVQSGLIAERLGRGRGGCQELARASDSVGPETTDREGNGINGCGCRSASSGSSNGPGSRTSDSGGRALQQPARLPVRGRDHLLLGPGHGAAPDARVLDPRLRAHRPAT